jgi:chitin synthase
MFFVVKHKNEGKLSSHMLFFEGFCKLFDPEYCILADVGIKPHEDAIYRMWAHMEKKPKCGGVCGYMGLQLENPLD